MNLPVNVGRSIPDYNLNYTVTLDTIMRWLTLRVLKSWLLLTPIAISTFMEGLSRCNCHGYYHALSLQPLSHLFPSTGFFLLRFLEYGSLAGKIYCESNPEHKSLRLNCFHLVTSDKFCRPAIVNAAFQTSHTACYTLTSPTRSEKAQSKMKVGSSS